MARRIKLNSPGVAEVLKRRETHIAVNNLAYEVAKHARAQGVYVGALQGRGEVGLPVRVFEESTDRARASVQLAHPAGRAAQAKFGVLTKAAAGLKVHSGSSKTLFKYVTKAGKTRMATQAQIDHWTRG